MSLDPHSVRIANEKLWAAYPELKGRALSAGSEDAKFRDVWNAFYRTAYLAEAPTPSITPLAESITPNSSWCEECQSRLQPLHTLPKDLFDPDGYVVSPTTVKYYDEMEKYARSNPNFRNILLESVRKEFLLDGLVGMGMSANIPDKKKIEIFLARLANQAGIDIITLRISHYGRNIYQRHSPTYQEVQSAPWTLASKENFHTIQKNGVMSQEISEIIEKYVNEETGEEFVFVNEFGIKPIILNDGINDGTYNYGPIQFSHEHLILDIYPWILWGTSPDDPTTTDQRLKMWKESFGI